MIIIRSYIYFKSKPGRDSARGGGGGGGVGGGGGGGGGRLFVFLNNSETVKVITSLLCNI